MLQDAPPPAAPTVEAVVIRPARLPPAASLEAFSVLRLEAEDIAGAQRLDQALSQSPGLSLFRRSDSLAANPTTQGLSLRSIAPSGAGRALVTLDGVPQNDPFGGWVIWASLPAEIVEGADIVRGGGAGPYGAGALTGVVALDERSAPGVAIDARAGELALLRGSAVVAGEEGRVGFMVAAGGGRGDGFVPVRVGAGPADTPLAVADWNLAGRVNVEFGEATLAARIGAYDERRGSGLLGANARASGQTASLTLARSPAGGRLGFRLQGWVRASDLYNSSVSVPANRLTTTPANIQYETPATGYGVNAAVRGGDPAREWEVGADLRLASGETRELFSYSAAAAGFLNSRVAGGTASVGGAYAETTWKAGAWRVTGGARIDQWRSTDAVRVERLVATGAITLDQPSPDRDGWVSSFRAGVRHDVGGGYLRAAAYSGFRAPTLNELHRPFRVGNRTTLANPDLEPERLAGIELGAGVEGGSGGLDATLFFNRLDDAITNVTIVPNLTLQRRNAGTVEATGLELEAWRQAGDALRLRAAATYTDAETEAGLRPAQAPRLTVTAGAQWQASARLALDLDLRHEGERFEDDQNLLRLAPATSLDARATWSLAAGAAVYVAASNILDEDIETGQTSGVISYGAPRIVSIGLTLRR